MSTLRTRRDYPAPKSIISGIKSRITPVLAFLFSLGLTLVSVYVVKATNELSFVVFATGATLTVALALMEEKLSLSLKQLEFNVKEDLARKLELYALLERIDDKELIGEVLNLARSLAVGEIPNYIASTRMPQLYTRSREYIYASNYSPTIEKLARWEENPRLRAIVESSRKIKTKGVKLTRTFILRRSEVFDDASKWKTEALRVLRRQLNAGIDVRIIWLDDLKRENLPPRLPLDRNFTIFDGVEVLETTSSQTLFRFPSVKVQEFLKVREEQLKYADSFERLLRNAEPKRSWFSLLKQDSDR